MAEFGGYAADAAHGGQGGQAVRVVLDLNPGAHPISGVISRPVIGDTVDFSGTLELLALLEAVTTAPAAGTVAQTLAEAAPGGAEIGGGSSPARAPGSLRPDHGPLSSGEWRPRQP